MYSSFKENPYPQIYNDIENSSKRIIFIPFMNNFFFFRHIIGKTYFINILSKDKKDIFQSFSYK